MNYKSIIFACLIWALSACQDVLDIVPDGRKTLDEMFQDDATVGAYLNSCYTNFPQYGLMNYLHNNFRIVLSDDAYDRGGLVLPIYDGNMTAISSVQENENNQKNNDNYGGFWNNYWANIRRCNVFLGRIGTAKVNLESDRNRWTAEAKTLRAFYNFELILRYGSLPIVTSPIGLDYDYENLTRPSFKACVDNVIKDCNEALAVEDFPWRITATSERYRFTKAIAAAIKSQAILFAASDLFNDGNNYWSEAEAITKKSLVDCLTNGYKLYTEVRNPSIFEHPYHEFFCNVADISADPTDKESILATKYNGSNFNKVAGLYMMNSGRSGTLPSQELVDAYGMVTTGEPVLNLEQPYLDEKHLQPNYNPASGYDPQNPYANRDPRFYATVYFNGSKRLNLQNVMTTIQTYFGGNNGINPPVHKSTTTGYYTKKYDHPTNGITGKPSVPISWRKYRLAELYLNFAEAANENGNTTEAIDSLNVIRKRAGMPAIVATGLSKEQARLRIRNERRVEMALEEVRYFDIRRWQKPDGDLSNSARFVTAMWIEKEGANLVYRRCVAGDVWDRAKSEWTGTGKERLIFSNKYLFWPIPSDEAKRLYQATGKIWQNPGW